MKGTRVTIKFLGNSVSEEVYYSLKLGPYDIEDRMEREFKSGQIAYVRLQETAGVPNHFDLYFDDGEYALEVSSEYFEIVYP